MTIKDHGDGSSTFTNPYVEDSRSIAIPNMKGFAVSDFSFLSISGFGSRWEERLHGVGIQPFGCPKDNCF
jgi:hypothetical protein